MTSEIVNWRKYANGVSNGFGEVYVKPSLTVPDMSIPIKDLFDRYVRTNNALPSPGNFNDDLPPGIEHLDEMERAMMLEDVRGTIAGIQSDLQSRSDERKRKKEEVVPPVDPVPSE